MAEPLEHAFLTRLAGLRERPEPLAALLVDFRGIEHGGDPRFFLTLDHYLESWLGARRREVFRLPGPRLLILIQADGAALLESGAGTLARLLRSHGFGNLAFTLYDVAGQAERLAADILPPGEAPLAVGGVPAAALAQVLEVERVLHGADVESLVREQPLWSFADPEQPAVVLTELAVALDELEMRLDLPLRRDAWLRHEVFARLDRGLMRHIARDRLHAHRPFALDLHTASVLDPGFAELAQAIPAEVRRRLTAELACWEVELSPERFADAAARLADLGFALAVDHVPLPALATLDLGGVEAAYIKALWSRPAPDTAGLLRTGVERFGAERLVLWRCDTPAALEAGRAAGVLLFQGRAADEAARTPSGEADVQPSARHAASAVADGAEEEAPATPGASRSGLLGWLFGRGG